MKALRIQSRSRLLWHACCLFGIAGLVATLGTGCGEEEQAPQDEDTVCTAEAVLARNPATGQCEWTGTCNTPAWEPCTTETFQCTDLPPEACALDSRCHLERQTVCTDCAPGGEIDGGAPLDEALPACGSCYDFAFCVPNDPPQPVGCAALDEATCLVTPACEALYGWTRHFDRAAPAPGEDPGCTPETCGTDPAPDPSWGYLGCTDAGVTTCDTIGDPTACDATGGCHWEWYGAEDGPVPGGLLPPCGECDPDDGANCACDPVPVPPPWGYCANDDQPQSCYDLYDVRSCTTTPGCEWIALGWDGGTDCGCLADEPGCDCSGRPAPSGGFCQPSGPQSCYDFYDERSCASAGCEWSYTDGARPDPGEPQPAPDCLCDAEDPNCGGCALPPAPPGYGYCHPPVMPRSCFEYGDMASCQTDPECQWQSLVVDGDDGSSDRIDPCWGAWLDQNGTCRSPNDGLAPDTCCAENGAAPEPWPSDGYCEPRPTPVTCWDYTDAISCGSHRECLWTNGLGSDDVDHLIDPCFGAALGPDGACYSSRGDLAPAECCEAQERPAPPPPEDCYMAIPGPDGACYDAFGQLVPDSCCDTGEPFDCTGAWRDAFNACRGPADEAFPEYCCASIPPSYCMPLWHDDSCSKHTDTFSCTSAGCEWAEYLCNCLPNDPACICPAAECITPAP